MMCDVETLTRRQIADVLYLIHTPRAQAKALRDPGDPHHGLMGIVEDDDLRASFFEYHKEAIASVPRAEYRR